jgi:hypothetical protein
MQLGFPFKHILSMYLHFILHYQAMYESNCLQRRFFFGDTYATHHKELHTQNNVVNL